MENSYVLPGLVKRRALLAGELEASQAKVRQLHADLAAVDAVIRQYDPAYPVDAIATKRARGTDAKTIERQRDLLELAAAAKLNRITPELHDAMAEVCEYLRTLTRTPETNGLKFWGKPGMEGRGTRGG